MRATWERTATGWSRLVAASLLALLLGLSGLTAASTESASGIERAAPEATATPGQIDAETRALLQKMSDYLGKLDRFSVKAVATQEVILPTGEALDSDRTTELRVERPNHFRAHVLSALRNVEVIYDGKKVTIYSPGLNVYGQWEAPPTIQQAIARAEEEYGLPIPMRDFLSPEAREALLQKVISGGYVGRSLINGALAHHLAFRGKDMDWQIWILDGDKPLPVRLAITDRSVTGAPRYMVTMEDWNTSPQFEAAVFTFTPPENAKQIAVLSATQIRQRQAQLQAEQQRGAKEGG